MNAAGPAARSDSRYSWFGPGYGSGSGPALWACPPATTWAELGVCPAPHRDQLGRGGRWRGAGSAAPARWATKRASRAPETPQPPTRSSPSATAATWRTTRSGGGGCCRAMRWAVGPAAPGSASPSLRAGTWSLWLRQAPTPRSTIQNNLFHFCKPTLHTPAVLRSRRPLSLHIQAVPMEKGPKAVVGAVRVFSPRTRRPRTQPNDLSRPLSSDAHGLSMHQRRAHTSIAF